MADDGPLSLDGVDVSWGSPMLLGVLMDVPEDLENMRVDLEACGVHTEPGSNGSDLVLDSIARAL